jgi:hypothetical protein
MGWQRHSIWVAQAHNEPIFTEAFREADDALLILSGKQKLCYPRS